MTKENITVNGIEYTPVEDKWKDLKQAYSEGAIIEYQEKFIWNITTNPIWYTDYEYRIKDGISIASWNKHKDLIKQYWNGAEIERYYSTIKGGTWLPSKYFWYVNKEYRAKQDKWKLPEYEDGAKWIIPAEGWLCEDNNANHTQAGRRRATKELAERCAKASKERDLLEAYRDYLEPDYVDPDWDDANIHKYYIYIHKGKYAVGYNYCSRDLGKVYGSKETMQKICDALNNKEITL